MAIQPLATRLVHVVAILNFGGEQYDHSTHSSEVSADRARRAAMSENDARVVVQFRTKVPARMRNEDLDLSIAEVLRSGLTHAPDSIYVPPLRTRYEVEPQSGPGSDLGHVVTDRALGRSFFAPAREAVEAGAYVDLPQPLREGEWERS